MQEIELNKRPPDTRVVSAKEKETVLAELNGRKQYCEEGIKNMSVTLYTHRAQNQYKGYVQNLNEIDEAVNVFDRKKVFVSP